MLTMVINDMRRHAKYNVSPRIIIRAIGQVNFKQMFDKVNMRPWATRQHYINVHAYQTHLKILHQQNLRLGYLDPSL